MECLTFPSTVDGPVDDDFGWALRVSVIARPDINKHPATSRNLLAPLALHFAVSAAVEVSVLCEVIEPLARAVEARCNVVSSIIARTSVAPSGRALKSPQPARIRIEFQLARRKRCSAKLIRFELESVSYVRSGFRQRSWGRTFGGWRRRWRRLGNWRVPLAAGAASVESVAAAPETTKPTRWIVLSGISESELPVVGIVPGVELELQTVPVGVLAHQSVACAEKKLEGRHLAYS